MYHRNYFLSVQNFYRISSTNKWPKIGGETTIVLPFLPNFVQNLRPVAGSVNLCPVLKTVSI